MTKKSNHRCAYKSSLAFVRTNKDLLLIFFELIYSFAVLTYFYSTLMYLNKINYSTRTMTEKKRPFMYYVILSSSV